jgi:hypothetical protein
MANPTAINAKVIEPAAAIAINIHIALSSMISSLV